MFRHTVLALLFCSTLAFAADPAVKLDIKFPDTPRPGTGS